MVHSKNPIMNWGDDDKNAIMVITSYKLSIINHRSVPPSAPSIAPNSTFTTDELCYHVSWFQLRMLLICLICLVFGCSVAIFVFCTTPSPHQPSNGHISASIRPIDPIFSAFFISIYLFWSYSRWKRLWKCFICLVFGCSVATFVFCTPSPHQPSNGHISSSIRPIDPIFSAFFISIHLFWSDVDMN